MHSVLLTSKRRLQFFLLNSHLAFVSEVIKYGLPGIEEFRMRVLLFLLFICVIINSTEIHFALKLKALHTHSRLVLNQQS